MPQKVCPRCGSLYASLKSATCPQCFAILETVDDDLGAALSAAKSEAESTPEYQEIKAAQDERFRHESFQACLGVVGITFITLVVSVIMIAVAVRRSHAHHPHPKATLFPRSATLDLLTERPAENAPIEDVMPDTVGSFKMQERDQQTPLSGTLTQIYHARYADSGNSVDAYAISAERPVGELNTFRDAMGLLTGMDATHSRAAIQFRTQHWHYGIIAPPGDSGDLERFRVALGAALNGRK
jgi:hypothetical protein